ncbi:MAG: oligoribonuclease [Vibrio sp.]
MNNQLYLAWLDLETGGLNGRLDNGKLGMEHYPIFEVAMIVTDAELNQVGLPLHIVIHQTEERIAECSEWAIETHTKSGLLAQVRESTITLEQAESMIMERLKSLGIEKYDRKAKTGAILAGNSIMFDRSYIMCQMPTLNDYLHYRQLDVSAFNLAVRMLQPEIEERVVKEYKHEALADIRESIAEYAVYIDALFGIKDIERFDYLSSLSEKLNAAHGTNYSWRVDINHNRVCLDDMGTDGHDIRKAIDISMMRTSSDD